MPWTLQQAVQRIKALFGKQENARQAFARLSYDEDLATQQHNVLNGFIASSATCSTRCRKSST